MSEQSILVAGFSRNKAWALVRLARPLNLLMFVTGVALGGWITAGRVAFFEANSIRLALAAASAALIGAGANVINDYFDLEVDRINRPNRPLPAGIVSRNTAWYWWAIVSFAGLALSVFISVQHVVMAVVTVALCYLYSARVKHWVLAGNVLVAFITPFALIVYGGWAVGRPEAALIATIFAFLTTLAREIIKDIEDVEGDATVESRTLPLVLGVPAATNIAATVLLATIALTPLPYLLWGYGGLYLIVVMMANIIMLRVLWVMTIVDGAPRASEASRVMKWAMIVGIIALANSQAFI